MLIIIQPIKCSKALKTKNLDE